MNTINIRRSIRTFTNKEVEKEKVIELLKAGMQAPSACNQQPWEFVVVRDEERKNELSKISPNATPILSANCLIVLLNRKNDLQREGMVDQDMGACTQNILLEVVEQGLGAVWIGVKSIKERMDFVANVLELPENMEIFSIIAIGYSDTENKFVDRFDETKIHFEKY